MVSALLCAVVLPQDFKAIAKQIEGRHKPKVLLVGFYHFANPKLDAVKADLDDHLSDKRQSEIRQLVEKLAKFRPTKIAAERPFGSSELAKEYEKWRSGQESLDVGETEQVGFRLAKLFGLKSLFPIDYRLGMDFGPTMELAQKALPDKLKQIQEAFSAAQKMLVSLNRHPVLENIRMLNHPEADRIGNGIYLRMMSVIHGDDHPGADLAATWWKRNLVWIANLSTIATEPDDRVLVICGSGHASLIRSILRDSIDFEVVPPLRYLK